MPAYDCARCGRLFVTRFWRSRQGNTYCGKACNQEGRSLVGMGLAPDDLTFNVRTHAKCPDCSSIYKRRRPFGTMGSPYCDSCAAKRCLENMMEPSGVNRRCICCGSVYETTKGREYQIKYGTRPAAGYCSVECKTYDALTSKDGMCVAPCDPPCPFPEKGHGSHGLCSGHDKRRCRGRPIDTPINLKMSARSRSSEAGIAYRNKLRRQHGKEEVHASS